MNRIANDSKKGLARARNAGVAAATAEIVAFLDDETVAARNWLAALVAPYADPDVLGVGGQVAPVWKAGVRAGSRPSSTGSLDAVAAACPLSEPWCTTSLVETCRCGAASSNAVVSMLRSVGSAPDDSLARRRRCASACRQASIPVNKLHPNAQAV